MLTRDNVLKVAELGRLNLSGAEVEQFTQQLGQMLDYVAVLDELDVSQVQPMAHVADVSNVFRDDVAGTPLTREQSLSNAPKTDGKYFLVPQILEHA